MVNPNDLNTLLGNQNLTSGMTEEEKKGLLEFTSQKPVGLLEQEPARIRTVMENSAKRKKEALKSKESSRTVEKRTNTMEKPKQDSASTQDIFQEITADNVGQVAEETIQEIDEASTDKSMWESAVESLGFGKEVAKDVWSEITNASDRVDWLTTLTVYAASRYMGNNGGLALANGLMRGMESKAKQNQLKQAMEQGKAQAEADAKQQEIDNQFRGREVAAKEVEAQASLLSAQSRADGGNEPTKALTGDEVNMLKVASDYLNMDENLANYVGSYIKEKGIPFTQNNIIKVAEAMRKKRLATDNKFFSNSLIMR